jgi:hypothetical protein
MRKPRTARGFFVAGVGRQPLWWFHSITARQLLTVRKPDISIKLLQSNVEAILKCRSGSKVEVS